MDAKIWNKSWWVPETRTMRLSKRLNDAVNKAGFHVLETVQYEFYPYGYTQLWLLAESHLAVHTFPEAKKSYIELSSCNKEYFDRFCEFVPDILDDLE